MEDFMAETIGGNAKQQLKVLVGRIECMEAEKAELARDIREVYAEAKGNGFDVKALRAVVRRRKQDANKLAEHEAQVETYLLALGILAATPLGQAAVAREFPDTSNPPFAP
jgi:uncharacterized protein (UPF0335 family)